MEGQGESVAEECGQAEDGAPGTSYSMSAGLVARLRGLDIALTSPAFIPTSSWTNGGSFPRERIEGWRGKRREIASVLNQRQVIEAWGFAMGLWLPRISVAVALAIIIVWSFILPTIGAFYLLGRLP